MITVDYVDYKNEIADDYSGLYLGLFWVPFIYWGLESSQMAIEIVDSAKNKC